MYVTEIGWSSENGGNWLNLGPAGQVTMIKKVYKYLTTERKALNLKSVVYFTWEDSTDGDRLRVVRTGRPPRPPRCSRSPRSPR